MPEKLKDNGTLKKLLEEMKRMPFWMRLLLFLLKESNLLMEVSEIKLMIFQLMVFLMTLILKDQLTLNLPETVVDYKTIWIPRPDFEKSQKKFIFDFHKSIFFFLILFLFFYLDIKKKKIYF
jgi:hypothetical protein